MNFGEALKALKDGRSVAREGWNGKNMYLWLEKGITADLSKAASPYNANPCISGVPVSLFEQGDAGIVTRLPHLCMRAADGSTVTGWLAFQTDILAEDWMVV